MSEKIYTSKRKWLNPKGHDDTGAISYSVSRWDETDSWVSSELTIWDCSRKITLNLSFCNEREAKQRAEKIDDLINALQDMKQAMGEAYDDISKIQESVENAN